MNGRGKQLNAGWDVYFKKLGLGGLANFISTFLTLPFFFAAVQKQAKGERSYFSIAQKAVTLEGRRKFLGTAGDAAKFGPKQSIAYLGVYNLLYDVFKDLGPVYSGLVLGSITGVTETLATSTNARALIRNLSDKTADVSAFDEKIIQRRTFTAQLIKNGIANPATIVSILCAREYFEKNGDPHSPYLAMWAGLAGGGFANLVIIPPVNTLLTRTSTFPDKHFFEHFKDIIANESVYALWKGAVARTVQKSLQAAIGFGMMDKGNKLIATFDKEINYGRFFKPSCNPFDQVEEMELPKRMRMGSDE